MRTALALFALFPMTLNSPAKAASATQSSLAFSITFATARSATPLDGRLLLLLSTDPAEEPRFQINDSLKTQIVFGLDVANWKPGEARLMAASDPEMQRDWATIGPKLRGKIHLYCGTLDNYYLNHAVKLTEEFLKSATNPPAEAEVKYGLDCGHCWNGDPSLPNHISRLRYNTMYVPKILEHIENLAPPGADLTSWRR